MFEMIGLLIDTVFLFGLSVLLGGLYAFGAWLLLRRSTAFRKHWILRAGIIPPVCCAIFVACAFFFSLLFSRSSNAFGDIAEPLPNGYLLTGLGKMPDFAFIDPPDEHSRQPTLLGGIARLGVEGPLVIGQYSHPLGGFDAPMPENAHFFTLDTRTGKVTNFATEPITGLSGSQDVLLVPPQLFVSHERSAVLLRWFKVAIYGGPLILASAGYLIFLLRLRAGSLILPEVV